MMRLRLWSPRLVEARSAPDRGTDGDQQSTTQLKLFGRWQLGWRLGFEVDNAIHAHPRQGFDKRACVTCLQGRSRTATPLRAFAATGLCAQGGVRMRVDIHHRCTDFDSYRAARVKSLFNVESGANFTLSAELDVESAPWQVGVIVGPSGSGKTSLGRAKRNAKKRQKECKKAPKAAPRNTSAFRQPVRRPGAGGGRTVIFRYFIHSMRS